MKFRVKYLPNKLDSNDFNARQEIEIVDASGKLEAAMLLLNKFPDATITQVLPLGNTEP
jgi:hypothetical protein